MAADAEAAAVVARLRALPSPPPGLEAPLDPEAALRLLCTPSGPRLALLEWICCRVNPPFTECLDELQGRPEEAHLKAVLALAEALLLCEAEDMALVDGTAPPEQQLGFIRDLLDAVPSKEEEGAWSGILLRASAFLQEILETPEGEAVLNPPPLSPGPETPPGTPPPRTEGEGLELEAELGEARRCLEMMEAENPELGGPLGPPPPLLPIGQTLAALASAFVGLPQTHSGGAAPPELAPCGPMAPTVCGRLKHLQQGLEAMRLLGDLGMEVGGGRCHVMETQVAALQQRFRGSLQD